MAGSMITWMQGWTSATADLFMASGLRGVVFLALILALTATLRSASAATRHAMLAAGVVGVLLMPFATLLPLRLPVLPSLPQFQAAATGAPAGSAELTPIAEFSAPLPSPSPSASPAPSPSPSPSLTEGNSFLAAPAQTGGERGSLPIELLLAGLWGIGTLVLAARALLGEWRARILVDEARPVEDADWKRLLWESADLMEIEKDVRLLRSETSAVAFTMGAVAPLIVIPASSDGWTEDRRRAVLLHELAHIRRRDVVLHNLGRLVTVLYWFNPLVWIAAARLRSESERAADDLVLRGGTRPSDYADHLLQIVTGTSAFPAPAPVLPFARKREFEGRIMAVLEERSRSTLSGRRLAGVFAGVALLVIPFASLSAAPQEGSLAAAEPPERPIKPLLPNDPPAAVEVEAGADAEVDPEVEHDRNVDAEVNRDAEVDVDQQQEDTGAASQDLRGLQHLAFEVAEAALRQMPGGAVHNRSNDEDPRAIAALIELLRTEDDVDVRRSAARALGELEAEEAVPVLSEIMLRDASNELRRTAAWALAEIESEAALDALLQALSDNDAEVRRMAMFALGEIESEASIAGVIAALSDPDSEVRMRAARALGEIEPEVSPPELIAALQDPVAEVREYALWALSEIEDPAAIQGIAQLLGDEDPDVRRAAIHALSELDGAGIDVLLDALNDPNPEVRRMAAEALGDL